MNTIADKFLELASFSKLFILQEFDSKDAIPVNPKALHLLQNQQLQNKIPPSSQDKEKKQLLQSTPLTQPPKEIEKLKEKQSAPINKAVNSPVGGPPASMPPKQDSSSINTPLDAKHSGQEIAKEQLPCSTLPLTQALQTKKSEPKEKKTLLQLEPLTSPPPAQDIEMSRTIGEILPGYITKKPLPSDLSAKDRILAWKEENIISPVIILAFSAHEKQLEFLKNLAKAISICLAPAKLLSAQKIEEEQKWDALLASSKLKLIIGSDYGMYSQPLLMKHYREQTKAGKHALGKVPLLLLSDISLYLKEPKLKSLLWRAICMEMPKTE